MNQLGNTALLTVHFIQDNVNCKTHLVHCPLNIKHCKMYTVHFPVYSIFLTAPPALYNRDLAYALCALASHSLLEIHPLSTMYYCTVHCTLCTVHCALCTVYCTLSTVYCVHCVLCTLCTVHFVLYTVLCELFTVYCSFYTVHCTVHCT